MKIVVFDPSGNFSEGKGITGICKLEDNKISDLYDIKAKDFQTREDYWKAIAEEISWGNKPDFVVCEDFVLYGHKAKQQTGSQMETSQLIGYLEMECHNLGIPFIKQRAQIKLRFVERILVLKGYLEKRGMKYYWNGNLTNDHMRDALKHGLYFDKYGKEKLING